MCGIFSAISFRKSFTDSDYDKFTKYLNLVSYRGPDSFDTKSYNSFSKEENKNSFNVFLGHRRLSIIDLSSQGNQPMKIDNIVIIFNGEIFNYIELKKDLEKENYKFYTKTDTEVIIRLYQKYGESGFELLNGMWAFIILDLNKNKLIASRDRFSIKPLFYFNNNNAIFFSSEIKQLIPLLENKNINRRVMHNFLQQNLSDYSDETFYEGIKKVKPKTNLSINLNNGEIEENQYWDYSNIDIEGNPFDKFRELMIDSVNIRLRSDVEVGALLSGGLDSSVISVLADKLNNGNLKTFSVISDDKKFSEEKFIDILINEKNIQNQKLRISEDIILKNIDKVIYHQDEPFGSFSVIAQYSIFEEIRKNSDIKVVLSGQGGDEILMGYLKYYFFYLHDLIKKNRYDLAIKELLFSLIFRTVIWQYRFSASKRYLPFYSKNIPDYIIGKNSNENMWKFNNIRERQIKDIDAFSVPALARYEDRNSMAFSIETRLPFLDHRLVNFLLNVKSDKKIKNGWTKYLLRKSIRELPNKIAWRRDKRSFLIPEEKWLKNELKEKVYDAFENSILDKMNIINSNKFLEYYKSYINGNRSIFFADISKVYIAELWAKKNFH